MNESMWVERWVLECLFFMVSFYIHRLVQNHDWVNVGWEMGAWVVILLGCPLHSSSSPQSWMSEFWSRDGCLSGYSYKVFTKGVSQLWCGSDVWDSGPGSSLDHMPKMVWINPLCRSIFNIRVGNFFEENKKSILYY